MICPSKPSYQSNKQTRDPHTNKSSALSKGYPQGHPHKEERRIQGAVTHFHHGPSEPCHVCPLQLHPAQAALLMMELMHIQSLVQRKFSFLQIQNAMCVEGQ